MSRTQKNTRNARSTHQSLSSSVSHMAGSAPSSLQASAASGSDSEQFAGLRRRASNISLMSNCTDESGSDVEQIKLISKGTTANWSQKPIFEPADRSHERVFVAYPKADHPMGYSDLGRGDYCNQVKLAYEPVLSEHNKTSVSVTKLSAQTKPVAETTIQANPTAEAVGVDMYGSYLEGTTAFEAKMKNCGFMKRAPLDVKLGIKSGVERDHVINRADLLRQDRTKMEKFSDEGIKNQTEPSKIPCVDAVRNQKVIQHMRAEEAKLVQAKKLYDYTFKRLRDEVTAVADHMVPASHNKAGFVDTWKLKFDSHQALETFFKQNLGGVSKPLTKQDEIAAMVAKALQQLPADSPKRAALETQNFKTRTEVDQFVYPEIELSLRLNEKEQACLRADKAFNHTTPKAVTVEDEIEAMVNKVLQHLPADGSSALRIEIQKQSFKTRTEVENFVKNDAQWQSSRPPVLRLNEAEKLALSHQKATPQVAMGQEIFEHAARFKQAAWEAVKFPLASGKTLDFTLEDGTVCTNLGNAQNPMLQVAEADGKNVLTFLPKPGCDPENPEFEVELHRDGQIIRSSDASFSQWVGASFNKGPVLEVLFGGNSLDKLTKPGTFEQLLGRMRAGMELEAKLEDRIYAHVYEALDRRMEAAGNPVTVHSPGDADNLGHYGVNFGSNVRGVVLGANLRRAQQGKAYLEGICGSDQWLKRKFGLQIIANQDNGLSYRYNPMGGDPFEIEYKVSSMLVKPHTKTAGKYEKKALVEIGGTERLWAQRALASLSVPVKQGGGSVNLLLRDNLGQPIMASGQLKPLVALGHDGQWQSLGEHGVDPFVDPFVDPLTQQSLVLVENMAAGQKLVDDLGRTVLDKNGRPVQQIEQMTLQAMFDGQPATPERIQIRHDAIRASELGSALFLGATMNERMSQTKQEFEAQGFPADQVTRLVEAERKLHQSPDHRPEPLSVEQMSQVNEAVNEAINQQLRLEITHTPTQVMRWERVPIPVVQVDEAGKPKINEKGDILYRHMKDDNGRTMCTYREVTYKSPSPQLLKELLGRAEIAPSSLVDWEAHDIDSIHSQSGFSAGYSQLPGIEITAVSTPPEGVQADPLHGLDVIPAVSAASSQPFGAAVPAAMRREQAILKAAEGVNWESTQHHDDAAKRAGVFTDAYGRKSRGQDPNVRHELTGPMDAENHGDRSGMLHTLKSGDALRGKGKFEAELTQRMALRRQELAAKASQPDRNARAFEFHDGARSADPLNPDIKLHQSSAEHTKAMAAQTRANNHIQARIDQKLTALEKRLELMQQYQQAPEKTLKFEESFEYTWSEIASESSSDIDSDQPLEKTFVPAKPAVARKLMPIGTPEPVIAPPSAQVTAALNRVGKLAPPSALLLKELQTEVQNELSGFLAALEVLDDDEKIAKGLDMENVIQRFFRFRDRWGITPELSSLAGMADVAEGLKGMAEAAHVASWLGVAAPAFTLIGSALLTIAGIAGSKDAMTDVRRLKQLKQPLQAYQAVWSELKALHEQAGEPGGQELSPELLATVNANLKGVNARLRAANRQLVESRLTIGTMGTLAMAGAVGLASGATAIATAVVSAKHAAETAAHATQATHAGGAASSAISTAALATVAQSLGVAYGSLIAVFGAVTAAQIARRLLELEGLAETVANNMGIDNGLRNALLNQIEDEKEALKIDVISRIALATTGGAVAALGGASLALGSTGVALPIAIPMGLFSIGMGFAAGSALRHVKSRHQGLAAIGAVERTTGLPTTFLTDLSQLNHLMIKLNTQSGYCEEAFSDLKQIKLNDADKEGLNQFKYGIRGWQALAKAVPEADRRVLIQKIVTHPQAAAPDAMQVVSRTTQLERDYLAEHKLPLLRAEVQLLLQEYQLAQKEAAEQAPIDGEAAGRERVRQVRLLATALKAKADTCFVEEARLTKLQNLDQRMKRFAKYLNQDFLVDPKLAAEWKELQIDFIFAHDMLPEAMGRTELKAVLAAADASANTSADVTAESAGAAAADDMAILRDKAYASSSTAQNPLRRALYKNLDLRFAKVLVQGLPDKLAYERRGAVEVARMMFMANEPVGNTVVEDVGVKNVSTDSADLPKTLSGNKDQAGDETLSMTSSDSLDAQLGSPIRRQPALPSTTDSSSDGTYEWFTRQR
jgi:hypothetical protein